MINDTNAPQPIAQRKEELESIIQQNKMALEMTLKITKDTFMEHVSAPTRDIKLKKSYTISVKKSLGSISKELVNDEFQDTSL